MYCRYITINSGDLSFWGLGAEDGCRRWGIPKDGDHLRGSLYWGGCWQQLPPDPWVANICQLLLESFQNPAICFFFGCYFTKCPAIMRRLDFHGLLYPDGDPVRYMPQVWSLSCEEMWPDEFPESLSLQRESCKDEDLKRTALLGRKGKKRSPDLISLDKLRSS